MARTKTVARTRSAPRVGRRVRAPSELSHARIRREALALIDRDGLSELSTRKLGQALGCEAMAIYYYYANKEALLDAVVDELMTRVGGTVAPDGADWIEALRQIAHAYRKLAHDHPRAFPLLATRRFASPGTFGFLEQLFELARRQGIPDRTAARFYRVVSSYCNGFALNELAPQRAPTAASAAALRKQFPRVAAVSTWLEPNQLDEMFAFGLELLLGALARAPAR